MRSFTAVVNPISGGGTATRRLRAVTALLEQDGAKITVEDPSSVEHAVKLAEDAAASGDVVLAAGGDGLVRDIAGALVTTGGTMGIVPAGRGNDFASALNLPGQPAELARLLRDAPARPIDVLEAGGVTVPGNVYAGIDSVATAIINNNRWIPGALLYRLAPLRAILTWRPPEYTVTIDGQASSVTAHTAVIANSGSYGHGLRIVPGAHLDDGLVTLLTVGNSPRREIVSFMRQARTGEHIHRSDVQLSSGNEITLDADRPLPVCADGDEIGTLPITVRVLPAALDIIAPELPHGS